tara:strand:+ start:324 stop:677 length:354 start_codon:yes stop_codon:yes gene_type:complete
MVLTTEDESDDMEAINMYESIRELNLYLKPVEGPIEQLYNAQVEPNGIGIVNGVTTIIGHDLNKDVKVQIIVDEDGDTSVTPTRNGRTVDGPWFEKDIVYFESGDKEEINIMIIQEV